MTTVSYNDSASLVTVELGGYLQKVVDDAKTPEDREKLESFIRSHLREVPKSLLMALGTEEGIQNILHPEEDPDLIGLGAFATTL